MRSNIRNEFAPDRGFTAMYIDPPPLRPNAEDALRHPSRVGDRLHHRDGSVTDMAGQPIKTPKTAKGVKA
jgi:hypothetical protein